MNQFFINNYIQYDYMMHNNVDIYTGTVMCGTFMSVSMNLSNGLNGVKILKKIYLYSNKF